MTIAQGLFERRNRLENPNVPISSPVLLSWFGGMPVDSGVYVNEISALRHPAVLRSVTVISSVAAALPLHTFKLGTRDKIATKLLDNPNEEYTSYELWRLNYMHRALWGNGFIQLMRAKGSGQIGEMWPIRPERVEPRRVPSDSKIAPNEKVYFVRNDKGEQQVLLRREMLHLQHISVDGLCGLSPVRLAAQAIGLGLAAEKTAARFFGAGAMLGGILQTEQKLNQDQADALKERWSAKVSGIDNSHEIAVLDSGAKFEPVTMPYRDAQFLESRQFGVAEIARIFGLPLFLLMETEKSTSWGTGLEQQALGFVQFDLNPTWLVPTEQRITKDLLDTDRYAKYAVQGLLRGDSKARAEFYRVMREIGAYSANDIRDLEDLTPVDGGDTYLQPMNMAPLGAPQPTPRGGLNG